MSVEIDGVNNIIKTNTISEVTSANGVSIDGVIVKDGAVDVQGVSDGIILDADGDTTISADTDDQIDFKIAGADDFQMTANTFTVASGSKITYGDGGSISSITGNIWRQTTDATLAAGSGDLTANWETIDSYGVGAAGNSMSESSGIFTFPTTGFYLVRAQMMVNRTSTAVDYTGMRIYATQDNSSYNLTAVGYTWFENTASLYASTSCETIFDCTNTTTHKVKFNINREAEVGLVASSTQNLTFVTFIKLGDT